MKNIKTARLWILVGSLGLFIGLIAHSALAPKLAVGKDQLTELQFTELSHQGAIMRDGAGKFSYADGRDSVQVEAVENVKPVAIAIAQTQKATPLASKPTVKKLTVKPTAKAPAVTKLTTKTPSPKAALVKKPAVKATAKPVKKAPAAKKPACPT